MRPFRTVGSLLLGMSMLLGCPRTPRVLGGHEQPLPMGAEVLDPVDGTKCPRTHLTESAVFEGRNFYFCTDGTRRTFTDDPGAHAYPD